MKTVVKKKLYQGKVELRDYEVKKYVEGGRPIRVIVGDEYMILTVAELKKGQVTNTQHSIYNEGQMYKLVGYQWKGKPHKDQEVVVPTDVRLRLKEIWEKQKNGLKQE